MLWLLGRGQTFVREILAVLIAIHFLEIIISLSLQEIHHERLWAEFFLVCLFLSHGTLVQLNRSVVAGLTEGHSELVGIGVSAEIDVNLVHDTADLRRDEAVVQDSEEGLQPHGLTTINLLSVHLPAVVDNDGVGEGGEVHLFAASALEDTFDGPAVDTVRHVLFSQFA